MTQQTDLVVTPEDEARARELYEYVREWVRVKERYRNGDFFGVDAFVDDKVKPELAHAFATVRREQQQRDSAHIAELEREIAGLLRELRSQR